MIGAHAYCDTCSVLYQLSYQANLELIIVQTFTNFKYLPSDIFILHGMNMRSKIALK